MFVFHGPIGFDDILVLDFSLQVADTTDLRLLLDENERLRAQRFVREVHRQRFVASHAALRLVLGQILGQSPSSLRFHQGAFGKPELVEPTLPVQFNLSHTKERALIGIAIGREVGVDIEQEVMVDSLELARFCFSAREFSSLQRFPPPERLQAFFRGWTRKESFIKAIGRGLSYPLDSFDVSLEEADDNVLLKHSYKAGELETEWKTLSLESERGFAAAVTAEGTDWQLIRRKTSLSELLERES